MYINHYIFEHIQIGYIHIYHQLFLWRILTNTTTLCGKGDFTDIIKFLDLNQEEQPGLSYPRGGNLIT